MASSYTVLGTEKMVTGENAGNWGTKTNTNLVILEQALGGYLAKSIAGGVQTTTLAITDGDSTASTSEARHHVIKLTGTITGNQTVTVPADVVKSYIVSNATSGAYTVLFKAASASGFTFAATNKGTQLLFADGTNIVDTGIGSVATFDLDGGELTLDADADTSITASTDDQIDFEIAGADDFTMTANAFNVLTGSHATFADSANAKFGTGNDMLVYHDGTNSYITNAQGALKIATETSGIALTIGHTTSETTIADNLTVTGTLTGTLATVAQGSVTSLGTLTALTVDDVAVNGKVVTMTGSASDTAVLTAGTNGTLSIVTTDAAAAAANIQITADGTVDIDSAGILTLDSGAAINIEPASGSAILLDGTISVDAGVVTGATSITSTAFVGDITGDVTGNTSGTAATVTTAAQSSITSLGTLTTLTVDNVIINGATIGHTGDIDLLTVASGILTVAGEVSATTLDIGGTNITSTAAEINLIDGGTSTGSITLADADGFFVNDGGTSKLIPATDIKTYIGSSAAADDLTAGDAAVSLATSSGAITIDSNASTVTVDGHTGVTVQSSNSGDITLDSVADIVIDAAGGNVEFKDAGTTQLTLDMDTTAGVQIIKLGVNSDDLVFQQYDGNEVMRINDDRKLYFYDDGGENISSDGTDFTFASGNDINLTATTDINVPSAVGMTFGNDGEKIEGDGTDLTIASSAALNLTATTDVVIPANVGVTFGSGEKIEGDSTDLTITSGGKVNLTATTGVVISTSGYITQGALTSSSNAVAWDSRAIANAYHLTTENTTFSAPSNATEGAFISLEINYDGSHTIGWNTVFEFAASTAPTTTDTDAKTDLFVFRYNGAVWQEVGRTLNLSES